MWVMQPTNSAYWLQIQDSYQLSLLCTYTGGYASYHLSLLFTDTGILPAEPTTYTWGIYNVYIIHPTISAYCLLIQEPHQLSLLPTNGDAQPTASVNCLQLQASYHLRLMPVHRRSAAYHLSILPENTRILITEPPATYKGYAANCLQINYLRLHIVDPQPTTSAYCLKIQES